jgi:cellobiose-specific phosphotransferase system component IIB
VRGNNVYLVCAVGVESSSLLQQMVTFFQPCTNNCIHTFYVVTEQVLAHTQEPEVDDFVDHAEVHPARHLIYHL